MKEDFVHKKECRICSGANLVKILDLGEMPLANSFIKEKDLGEPEKKFPLVVYFCENCGLLQLLDVVNPEILFRHYDYLTSASRPLVEHFIGMAYELADKFIDSRDDLMVEIGGNDAILLESVKDRCRVLNVEPAQNVAELSIRKGVETINEFFNKKTANEIFEKYGPAKVVVANNVIAHIDDIKDVFEGVKNLIGNTGVFVFEIHWVDNLIGEGGFDQIYHEHLCYFSLTALKKLVEQLGLKIFDVQLVPVHGQSLRVYIGKNFETLRLVDEFSAREKVLGLDKTETFLKFSEKVEKSKKELLDLLLRLKSEGKTIAGYGAPAKGNILLNYFGIGKDILDFLTDTTPSKQGKYSPGMRIPIHRPEKLNETKPDYVLLLAWNYTDTILKKEKELREKGIKFVIPVPEVKVV